MIGKFGTFLFTLSPSSGFPDGSDQRKSPPAMQETQVRPWISGQEWTHSSILAWKIPWAEEPGGLQSMGSQRVGHNWLTYTFFHLSIPAKQQLCCQFLPLTREQSRHYLKTTMYIWSDLSGESLYYQHKTLIFNLPNLELRWKKQWVLLVKDARWTIDSDAWDKILQV